MTINNIQLKYLMDNDLQDIEFTISKIDSNEFKICINEINLRLQMKNIKDNNSKSLRGSRKNKKMNIQSYLIVPEQTMEIYIENIVRLKQRKEQIDKNFNKPSNIVTTDINISIKDIQLEPLESILYINDIYNVIIKEEIYNNNSNNYKKGTDSIMSMSSRKSENSNKNEFVESLMDPNKSKSKLSNKEPLFTITFTISLINCKINDERNQRSIEVNIKDFLFKNLKLLCKKIEFLIIYEPKDFGDKVKVDLGSINNINLEIVEKINYNLTYHIIIDEIIFTLCKDSLLYIQDVLDTIGKIMPDCFIQAKKSNKIVVTKRDDKILSTYDIDENQNEQESVVFGNNVAKSICLISSQNEFVLDVDEDYLDNLKNEKEEPSEIIDDEFKYNLRERKRNKDENDLSLVIKKIHIGLYKGLDFDTIDDIRTKSETDENKKEEEKENENEILLLEKEKEKSNNEIVNEINEKLDNLKKSLQIKKNNDNDGEIKNNLNINNELNNNIDENKKMLKKKETDSFEIIDFNPYKKITARDKNNYLLLTITDISLSILYEKKNSYEIEFIIKDLEIKDNLSESNFKRLFAIRKNLELDEENQKDIPFLLIFVDISNSQNELSTNTYSDFNITCEISLASSQLMVHQNSLLFILDYFINNNSQDNKKAVKDHNLSLKLYNMDKYHTKPSFVLDSQFNQIFVEDFGEEQND